MPPTYYRRPEEQTPEQRRKGAMALPELRRRSAEKSASTPFDPEAAPGESEEMAPPRSAMLQIPNPLAARGSSETIGIPRPFQPRGAGGAPDLRPDKTESAANTAAAAQAALNAVAAGEVGPTARPVAPADPAAPKVGTGTGAAAETPARKPPGPTDPAGQLSFVKLPDGRTVIGNRGKDYVAGGGTAISYQAGMEGLGAPQAERFTKDRASRPMDSSARVPYSGRVRGLLAEAPETPLSFEGDAGFGTSPPASGGPSEGYRRLSGLEQALSRREWLEGRANMEQGQELERALAERRLKETEIDPLEMARIRAQGQMGGKVAEVQADQSARLRALDEYDAVMGRVEALRNALAEAPPEMATRINSEIEDLLRVARDRANIIQGQRLTDPAQDRWGGILDVLAAGRATGTPATGAS